MNPRNVVVLAFAICLFPAVAAADDVELLPHWKAGEVWKYEMVKGRQRLKAGKAIMDVVTRTRVTVEVVRADDTGYLLRWTQGATTFDNPEHGKNPVVKAMVDLVKDLSVELVVDKEGSLEGVKNWKDLRKKTLEVLDLITGEMTKAGVPRSTADSVRTVVEPLIATEESIATFLTREPGLLLIPLGHVYPPGKPVPFIDEIPNPFGGESFPTKSEYKLTRTDAKTGHHTVVMKQTLDPVQLNTILEKSMKDLAKRLGKPLPPGQGLPEFSVDDETTFQVDPKAGRVVSASHTRRMKTAGIDQKETIELKPLAR